MRFELGVNHRNHPVQSGPVSDLDSLRNLIRKLWGHKDWNRLRYMIVLLRKTFRDLLIHKTCRWSVSIIIIIITIQMMRKVHYKTTRNHSRLYIPLDPGLVMTRGGWIFIICHDTKRSDELWVTTPEMSSEGEIYLVCFTRVFLQDKLLWSNGSRNWRKDLVVFQKKLSVIHILLKRVLQCKIVRLAHLYWRIGFSPSQIASSKKDPASSAWGCGLSIRTKYGLSVP
jgi:hypothetical protein